MSEFFASFYKNAKNNAVIVMQQDGEIQQVNSAFTNAFGYTTTELEGKNFSVLFLQKDRDNGVPVRELQTTLEAGACSDDNYLLHKDGVAMWVAGESVRIEKPEGPFIVKVIHNINAQKQFERFLLEPSEFLDSILESIRDAALLVLDHRLVVVNANQYFYRLFGITDTPVEGSRLSKIPHPFFQHLHLNEQLRNVLVTGDCMIDDHALLQKGEGEVKNLTITCKLLDTQAEKKLLLIIKD